MPVALTTRSGIGGPPRYVRAASEISTVNPNTTSRIVVSRHQGESPGADVGRQPCARSSSRATRAGLPSVRAGLVPAEESARHEVRQHALRLVRIHPKRRAACDRVSARPGISLYSAWIRSTTPDLIGPAESRQTVSSPMTVAEVRVVMRCSRFLWRPQDPRYTAHASDCASNRPIAQPTQCMP